MDIAYLVPGQGLTPKERARRQKLLQQAAGEALTVTLLEVEAGPAAIETAADEVAAVAPTVELARKYAHRFDALIIGCFGDVGIHALRKAIDIPIIGPARVTYATAAASYPAFGILSLNSGFIEEERELVRHLGVLSQVAAVRALDLAVDTIIEAPAKTMVRIEALVTDMDLPAVVPGCMSMAFLLLARRIDRIGNTRIVNPLQCALRAASAMIV